MEILSVNDKEFLKYGKVLRDYDLSQLLRELEHTPLTKDVKYIASSKELENTGVYTEFMQRGYGGMPIQIGYCNGDNYELNGLEYHRNSEINVALYDMILLLGLQHDITEDFEYDTSKVKAFLVPAKTAVEIYATTLHYAPCTATKGGFRCAVVLPKGTNTEIDFEVSKTGEDRLLTAKNKWLLAHEDAKIDGAFCGLKGKNINIKGE